jgi:cobalt-zinc-cadmium efflux system protein
MESAPRRLDGAEVKAVMAGVEGVEGVHLWTITGGFESLSAHLEVGDRDRDDVLAEVSDLLRDRFDIEHTTLQLEPADRCAGGGCGGEASRPG